ncbi:MAG: hypothetical protein R3B36_23665 [Polyangiaceae bacterium]
MNAMRAAVVMSAACAVLVACAADDIEGGALVTAGLDAESKLLKMSLGAEGCGVAIPDLGDAFLAALPDCANGEGKCVPPSPMMTAEMAAQLAPCEGGASCVPVSFLKAGKVPLTPCTSFGEVAGVCVSRAIPALDQLTFLPRDKCKETERCAPCASPLDQRPTGICDIGKPPTKPASQCPADPIAIACPHKGKPVLDVSKLEPCADKGMHCVPKQIVPAAFAAQLGKCPAEGMLCAPDKAVEANGQYVAKTCASVGDAEGRCMHAGIPEVAGQAKLLPVDACDAEERCVPCFDPFSGAELPTCRVACDPGPTKPAVVFPKCAEGRGRCVPKSAVPPDMSGNLRTRDCEDDALCAPSIALDRTAKPQTCAFKLVGIPMGKPAVCVEDVLSLGFALSKSDCQEGFKCTPCENPLNGTPTGLPGCPP